MGRKSAERVPMMRHGYLRAALLLALVAVIEEYGRAGEALCGVAPELEGNGHFRRENKG